MADGEKHDTEPLSPERLEALLRQHLRWLRGWLGARMRGVERQDVDDLCQDVLLRAIRGIHSLRDPSRFPSWLYRIASNVLRDHVRDAQKRRKEAREVEPDSTASPDAGDGSTPSPAERREDFERALDALLELPPRLREPMLLRHVDELSYQEIAAILGISTGAVQVRISRARDRLRRTDVYRSLYGTSRSERRAKDGTSAEIIELDRLTKKSETKPKTGKPERTTEQTAALRK